MFLEKWRNRALISIVVGLLISELLFVFSGYIYRINGFILAIILYIVITFLFSWYLGYKMEKEIYQDADEEILDDIDI